MLISGCGQSFCTCATVSYRFNSSGYAIDAESCVHPSQASICSKILKFAEIGATAGSGTNYESSY